MFGKADCAYYPLAVADQKSYLSIIEPIYLCMRTYSYTHTQRERHTRMDRYVVVVVDSVFAL